MISKEKFVKYLNDVIKYEEKISEYYDNTNGTVDFYKDDVFFLLVEDILKMLKEETNDKDDWIEFYCFECDWGKDVRGRAFNEDNTPIDFSTPEKLYDLIMEGQE